MYSFQQTVKVFILFLRGLFILIILMVIFIIQQLSTIGVLSAGDAELAVNYGVDKQVVVWYA